MDKELIIRSSPTEVEIALLEDKKLVEIHRQAKDFNIAVGDVYLGSIKMLRSGLNAGFLDIGVRKDAFLHYTDLGPQINSLKKYTNSVMNNQWNSSRLENFNMEADTSKHGKIDQIFKKNNSVLVQVLKEPISTKGPRMTCEITLPGRFMVLTPFSNTISVSKKISSEDEKKRLKVLVESVKPRNFGVIIRTAAEGKKVADLHEEIRNLTNKWQTIFEEVQKSTGPGKLLSEIDKTSSILRDILNDSFNKVIIDDPLLYQSTKEFVGSIAKEKEKIVSHYTGKKPVFDHYGVNKQIKSSFSKTPTMSSGAYLVIEGTEAMHVIDVNSGPKNKKTDQETASLSVNVESAREIARQLRLRDIGGLIIIDFIDMRNRDNKKTLFNVMKESMQGDRAQHTILPLTKFGLMQITRQRVKPEMKINTQEQCPTCNGSGKSEPSILVTDEINQHIEYIFKSSPDTKIALTVHPYVESFLKKGFPNMQWKWFMKYKKWIPITSNNDFYLNKVKYIDNFGDEIRLG